MATGTPGFLIIITEHANLTDDWFHKALAEETSMKSRFGAEELANWRRTGASLIDSS